jgi:hypothetical protein
MQQVKQLFVAVVIAAQAVVALVVALAALDHNLPGEAVFSRSFKKELKYNIYLCHFTHETENKLPSVQVAAGLRFEECTNAELLALKGTTTVEDVIKRIVNGHVAFIACINNVPAAFGWVARSKAMIGELNHA